MNLMGTGMWAIGFALVRPAPASCSSCFVAAPMRRWHLLAAQVLARLVFLALEAGALLGFAVWRSTCRCAARSCCSSRSPRSAP